MFHKALKDIDLILSCNTTPLLMFNLQISIEFIRLEEVIFIFVHFFFLKFLLNLFQTLNNGNKILLPWEMFDNL